MLLIHTLHHLVQIEHRPCLTQIQIQTSHEATGQGNKEGKISP